MKRRWSGEEGVVDHCDGSGGGGRGVAAQRRGCGSLLLLAMEVEDALESRAEVARDVACCGEREVLRLFAFFEMLRRNLDAGWKDNLPVLRHLPQHLHLSPRKLFLGFLGPQSDTSVGFGGGEGGGELAGDVELCFEEKGCLAGEVGEGRWSALEGIEGRQCCTSKD